MDIGDNLLRIAHDQLGDFEPLILMGLVVGTGDTVSLRLVANETLLKMVLGHQAGRQWLHTGLDRLCDGLKPPDDQPKDMIYTHIVVNGTGFSS